MGLKDSGAAFQCAIELTLAGLDRVYPYVDDVPTVIADLNSVAHAERTPHKDEQPASEIDDGVLESDSEASR